MITCVTANSDSNPLILCTIAEPKLVYYNFGGAPRLSLKLCANSVLPGDLTPLYYPPLPKFQKGGGGPGPPNNQA